MKYFGFLARYVILPLIILRALLWWDRKRGKELPDELQNWPEDDVLSAHVAVAVAYTTPWDNYLVATNVWDYDDDLVTGFRIGWVPIEEYSFFVLQSLLTGSLTQYLARRIPADSPSNGKGNYAFRMVTTGSLATLWAASARTMFSGKPETTYRDLILTWSLFPIMVQSAFGADILWRHRTLILTTLLSSTLYLGITDSLAINSGTWSINPEKTTKKSLVNGLPFEEGLFFLMTNVLLTFGVTLVQAKESEKRLPAPLQKPYKEFKDKWLNRRS